MMTTTHNKQAHMLAVRFLFMGLLACCGWLFVGVVGLYSPYIDLWLSGWFVVVCAGVVFLTVYKAAVALTGKYRPLKARVLFAWLIILAATLLLRLVFAVPVEIAYLIESMFALVWMIFATGTALQNLKLGKRMLLGAVLLMAFQAVILDVLAFSTFARLPTVGPLLANLDGLPLFYAGVIVATVVVVTVPAVFSLLKDLAPRSQVKLWQAGTFLALGLIAWQVLGVFNEFGIEWISTARIVVVAGSLAVAAGYIASIGTTHPNPFITAVSAWFAKSHSRNVQLAVLAAAYIFLIRPSLYATVSDETLWSRWEISNDAIADQINYWRIRLDLMLFHGYWIPLPHPILMEWLLAGFALSYVGYKSYRSISRKARKEARRIAVLSQSMTRRHSYAVKQYDDPAIDALLNVQERFILTGDYIPFAEESLLALSNNGWGLKGITDLLRPLMQYKQLRFQSVFSWRKVRDVETRLQLLSDFRNALITPKPDSVVKPSDFGVGDVQNDFVKLADKTGLLVLALRDRSGWNYWKEKCVGELVNYEPNHNPILHIPIISFLATRNALRKRRKIAKNLISVYEGFANG